MGVSYGGEAALLLGIVYSQLVHAVVAYVPSERVHPAPGAPSIPAWTLNGSALAEEPIAVENIVGPVFAVGGDRDGLWPSGIFVRDIRKRMRAHGRHAVTALVYRKAGHAVGVAVPNIPTRTRVQSRYGELYLGGSPRADELAREDSWPKLLRFLARL
jgi:dienelactone hydrolase